MQTTEIVNRIVAAVQQAPEKAQELIADPKGAVAAICGTTDFDINAVVQGTLARAAELGLDFSDVDISKLDLSQLDLTKLDLIALQDAAGKLTSRSWGSAARSAGFWAAWGASSVGSRRPTPCGYHQAQAAKQHRRSIP